MMYRYLIYFRNITLLFFLFTCGGTIPTKQRDLALSIIEKAKLVNAEKYDPEKLKSSEEEFNKGEKLIDYSNKGNPNNVKAKTLYEDSTEYASLAYENSVRKYIEELYEINTDVLKENDVLKSSIDRYTEYGQAVQLYEEANGFKKMGTNFQTTISNYKTSIQIFEKILQETKKNKTDADTLLGKLAKAIDNAKGEKLENEIDTIGLKWIDKEIKNVSEQLPEEENVGDGKEEEEGQSSIEESGEENITGAEGLEESTEVVKKKKITVQKMITKKIVISFVNYEKKLLSFKSDVEEGYYLKIISNLKDNIPHLESTISNALAKKKEAQNLKKVADELLKEEQKYKVATEYGEKEHYKKGMSAYKKGNDHFSSSYYSKSTPYYNQVRDIIPVIIEQTKKNMTKAKKSMDITDNLMEKLKKIKAQISFPDDYNKVNKELIINKDKFKNGYYMVSNKGFLSLKKKVLSLSDKVLLKRKEAEEEYNLSKKKLEDAKKKKVEF